MAAELPIVTTPVFGISEQVRPDVNAIVFEPGDVTALARALVHLLEDGDERKRLAANSPRVLETLTNYESMVAAYGDLFREAWLTGGPRGADSGNARSNGAAPSVAVTQPLAHDATPLSSR